jgi:hypothetical protein
MLHSKLISEMYLLGFERSYISLGEVKWKYGTPLILYPLPNYDAYPLMHM